MIEIYFRSYLNLQEEIVDDGIESDDDITLDQLQKQLQTTSKPKTSPKSSSSDQQKRSPSTSQKVRKKEPRKGLKLVTYSPAYGRNMPVSIRKMTYLNSRSEPFKFNLESIEEVSIGDFYFIDPEELDQGSIPTTRPLLCKVMEIDTDLEIFTAEWWTMVS